MGKSTKISHEELQRDEVAESISEFLAWLKKNQQKLIALVVLIVVGAIGWSMYSSHKAAVIRDSNALLAQALNEYQRLSFAQEPDQVNDALENLVGILDNLTRDYSNTTLGNEAQFIKGAAYYSQDMFTEARQAYTEYRDNARSDDESARAEIALGYTNENESFFTEPQNQRNLLDQALTNYETAAERVAKNSYLRYYALMGQARIYELTKRNEEAIAIYQQIIKERPAPDSGDKGFEKTTGLGGQMGEIIDKMIGDQEKLISFEANARQSLERLQAQMGEETGPTVIEATASEQGDDQTPAEASEASTQP